MLRLIFRSISIWLLLTIGFGCAAVFHPGLDLQRTHDDYLAYWDFRLFLFLTRWIIISIPVWAAGTLWLLLRQRNKPAAAPVRWFKVLIFIGVAVLSAFLFFSFATNIFIFRIHG